MLAYILLGGLTSAIYNEVLQFFLIVFGFVPLVALGLYAVGGWDGLRAGWRRWRRRAGFRAGAYTHTWSTHGRRRRRIRWASSGSGWSWDSGFVLSFGYWCTDFLVVQRAMAADSMTAARRTPLIAAVPKMLFPFLVILPGMIALVLGAGAALAPVRVWFRPSSPRAARRCSTARARSCSTTTSPTPMMLVRLFPSGMLGLGLTALLASFMSGMAGNVTAFNTVWTYDIYQSLHPAAARSDAHYLWMGRVATVVGIALAVAAAYVAGAFNNIMDLLQLVFAFVNAPLFATFALGMFWKRTTGHGAFVGLLAGTLAAAIHHGLTLPAGVHAGVKGGYLGAAAHLSAASWRRRSGPRSWRG